MSRAIPLIRELPSGDVYIRIAATLSFTLAPALWRQLRRSVETRQHVPVPLYSIAASKRMLYVVMPPFKAKVPPPVVEKDTPSGIYYIMPSEYEEEMRHGGVEMYTGIALPVIDVHEAEESYRLLRSISPGRARVLVESFQETRSIVEYVAVNGRRVRIIQLRGALYGRRIGGHGYTPIAVIVPPSMKEAESPWAEPGDEVECYWLYAKHGRGDFYESGTSHQIDVCIPA